MSAYENERKHHCPECGRECDTVEVPGFPLTYGTQEPPADPIFDVCAQCIMEKIGKVQHEELE